MKDTKPYPNGTRFTWTGDLTSLTIALEGYCRDGGAMEILESRYDEDTHEWWYDCKFGDIPPPHSVFWERPAWCIPHRSVSTDFELVKPN